MMYLEQETTWEKQEKTQEEQEIGLLRELLPRIDGECRAYIKGLQKRWFTRRKSLNKWRQHKRGEF